MTRKILLTATFALFATAAAADEDYNYAPACDAPAAPAIGAPATAAELDAAHDAANGFMRVSDSYQQCLGRALGKQQNTAFFMHSNVPVHIVKQIEGKAAANQKQKEQVAAAYNAAAQAFSARH
ncbi:MAG: hypothetical protein JOZ72_12220 [Alphaproteobacteria bacterium]|nr:hypothetical protein [Alphaproteobacteria bacterium]